MITAPRASSTSATRRWIGPCRSSANSAVRSFGPARYRSSRTRGGASVRSSSRASARPISSRRRGAKREVARASAI